MHTWTHTHARTGTHAQEWGAEGRLLQGGLNLLSVPAGIRALGDGGGVK